MRVQVPERIIREIQTIPLQRLKEDLHEIKSLSNKILFLEEDEEIISYLDLSAVSVENKEINIKKEAISIEQVPHIKMNEKIDERTIAHALLHSIALVYKQNNLAGYVQNDDLFRFLITENEDNFHLFKIIGQFIPQGVAVIGKSEQFIYCNDIGLNLISMDKNELIGKDVIDMFHPQIVEDFLYKKRKKTNHICQLNKVDVLASFNPVIGESNKVEAVIVLFQSLKSIEHVIQDIEYVKNLKIDLNAVLATYEEILVVSEKGEILRFSDNYIDNFWWTDNPHKLIGGNMLQFEREGKISPSVTRLVLEEKKQVSILQQNKTGKSVMAIGIPVFNEEGNIHRIVIHSKDVTETVKLKSELNEIKKITNEYKKQLDFLKSKTENDKKFVYSSTKMEQVMSSIDKIAQFDSTIMITGESGVGKELIARAIHERSMRSDEAFLAINCGAIPDNLLESELFGYVPGAFTGASEKGKVGFFEKADKGILFLDEISELPQELQVKLLRVLQEKEVTPIGGTDPIPIDVQIISATNKNLVDMVARNEFREDLYYRINVIPITVPPLRERVDDISPLAYHFISELNNKYNKNYYLSPDALSLLEAYSWPGNVRELQNLVERFVVFADEDLITADFIRPFLNFGSKEEGQVIVTDLLPLKEAQDLLETQLISLALKRYKTITKASKALGVSQSTISRKYKKLLEK